MKDRDLYSIDEASANGWGLAGRFRRRRFDQHSGGRASEREAAGAANPPGPLEVRLDSWTQRG